MRYCDKAAVDKCLKAFKAVGTTMPLDLRLEPNTEAPGGRALAVYNDGDRVGYIRNADLPGAFSNMVLSCGWKYTLQSVQANYWVLKGKPPALTFTTAQNATGIIAATPTADTANYTFINSTKDEKKMINTNSMRDSFFREVKNVAIDIQSGKFGVLSNDGISVYTDGGVSVNPIADFGVKVPAFAMRVAVGDLKAGDIIINGAESTFFKQALKEGGYEVVTLSGEVRQVGSVTNMFFGKNTVLAVKNMFGEGTNPMMMAMMMGDSKEGFDMKTFALMSMMGNSGNKEGGMDQNMLMMMMLMGK